MANDFAAIHIYVGDDRSAQEQVVTTLARQLTKQGYTLVDEAALNPYDPRLNLVGQRSRSVYISPQQCGWVSVVDEDIFRLDELAAEVMLAALSQLGPAILLWGIDQFVWGYTIATAGQIRDRYTEDFIEFDAYNSIMLHQPNLSLEAHRPRYAGDVDALTQFFTFVGELRQGEQRFVPTDAAMWQQGKGQQGEQRFAPTKDNTSTQHSALSTKHSAACAAHYIEGYRKYYRATADNENTYMDELIAGGGQIYADAWAQELAAELSIPKPDLRYLALVQAEAHGTLPEGWQAMTFRRPPLHQPNYSVALTLYCPQPLSVGTVAEIFNAVTATLPEVGQQGWTEIELAGTYYNNAVEATAAIGLRDLADGEHLAARYYPGCNLMVQRRGGDLPHEVILLEYPSVLDDRFTTDVLASAPEAAALQRFVFSDNLRNLAMNLFTVSHADYGYISVAGGGVGGDGGGRANGPGAMLADALAKPLAQISSRVAVKEAQSWRQRWADVQHNIRGVYWANLLHTPDDELQYRQIPATLEDYAEGKGEVELVKLLDELLPLLGDDNER